MATKTATQRVQDTLAYLQNTNLGTLAGRTAAHQLAQGYVNTRFPLGAASPGYDAFSNQLSLGYHLLDDPNERRRMARALMLLWRAIEAQHNGFQLPRAQVGQISLGTVDRELTHYIRKAHCVQDETAGGHAGATQALADFTQNPLAFLRDNRVWVQGSGTLQGPPNTLPCNFYYNADRDRYEFVVNAPALAGTAAAPITVDSVTAFHWTNARYVPAPVPPAQHDITTANFGAMQGIQLGGNHIMVTTQFTGCAFCTATHNNHVYCAHVSPYVPGFQHNTTGQVLAQRILANGAFANAGGAAPSVYGRNAGSPPHQAGYNIGGGGGNTTYMTIVGFPVGGTYRIYSQTTENDRIQGQPVQVY